MPLKKPSLYKTLRSQLSRRRTTVWRLFENSVEDAAVTITYAGLEKNKEYLKAAVFENTCREEVLGRIWKYRLGRVAGDGTSILVSEYGDKQTKDKKHGQGFMIPFWLGWIADISGDVNEMVKAHRTLQYNVGKIRQNHLDYRTTDDAREFEKFYDRMYLPYTGRRFDNTAIFMSREEMNKQRGNCQLLYVTKDREDLSGMLVRYEPECPRIWSIGVKNDNADYIREGALGALYYFLIRYLKEKGYDRVHFGGTRAFLNDGVLNYKKKWPIVNAGFTKQGFHLQPVSMTPGTIKLLTNYPFIYVENNKLNTAVFLDPENGMKAKQIKKMSNSYLLQGLDKVVLYVFGGKEKVVEQTIPEQYADTFTVRSAERVFAS